ncbi:hypothetical protein JYG30_17070 [Fibrella sp. USSR17]
MITTERNKLYSLLRSSIYPFSVKSFLQATGYGTFKYDWLDEIAQVSVNGSRYSNELEILVDRKAAIIDEINDNAATLSGNARSKYFNDIKYNLSQFIALAKDVHEWMKHKTRVKSNHEPISFTDHDCALIEPVESAILTIGTAEAENFIEADYERPIDKYSRWLGIDSHYINPELNLQAYQYKAKFNDALSGLAMWSDVLLSINNAFEALEIDSSVKEAELPTLNHPVSEPLTTEERKHIIHAVLAPLSGLNPQKNRILLPEDFQRLITYSEQLAMTNSIPEGIKPIGQTGISNEHIRYTFYRLHKRLFGTRRIHTSFITFLHTVFTQFNETATTTTKAKFSAAPKSYATDFAGYIGEEL